MGGAGGEVLWKPDHAGLCKSCGNLGFYPVGSWMAFHGGRAWLVIHVLIDVTLIFQILFPFRLLHDMIRRFIFGGPCHEACRIFIP